MFARGICMARCLLCDGKPWRQWFLCLPCIRLFLDITGTGRSLPMLASIRDTRRVIIEARATAAAVRR
jgi:hypothetical protein